MILLKFHTAWSSRVLIWPIVFLMLNSSYPIKLLTYGPSLYRAFSSNHFTILKFAVLILASFRNVTALILFAIDTALQIDAINRYSMGLLFASSIIKFTLFLTSIAIKIIRIVLNIFCIEGLTFFFNWRIG